MDTENIHISLISAVAEDRTIGKDGTIPWHYPKDLEHFQNETEGHPVVMGRKTFESITNSLGNPLPNRINVVLTTQDKSQLEIDSSETVCVANSVSESIEIASKYDTTIYIAGGQTVYEQFLNHADEMIITEIEGEYNGDSKFPHWEENNWNCLSRESYENVSIVWYGRDNF